MRALIVIVLVAAVFALAAFGINALNQTRDWTDQPVTINVIGEGEITATPDIGTFTFSARGEGDDAQTAQNVSAQAINDTVAFLMDSGVEEKDIETSGYTLSPKYRWESDADSGRGQQILDGYEAYQTVTVKVRNLDESGTLISGVGERGATNISGLSFTIDDPDSLQEEARNAAIVDARAKADALAVQLGVRLVKMVGYSEEGSGYVPKYDTATRNSAMTVSMESSVAPEMPTGEETITSRVYMTYEVR